MEYFSLLHLQKEPFSNSPDPEMFFQSTQHQGCLQKLELSIRLKRGLSVVIGDIGTGKSTLCRQLIRVISGEDNSVRPYLLLDPEFGSPLEFLTNLGKTFGIEGANESRTEWQLKDSIKNHLLEQAVNHGRIQVLIIDEGQKLPDFGVELLREFLNFETNQHKLLQIVIFAQEEFSAILQRQANVADRISTYHRLRPLNFRETQAMIDFRLDRAHTAPGPPPRLFSFPAVLAIYCLTRGYPRRIVMLCSKVIIGILVSRDQRAGILQVLKASSETGWAAGRAKKLPWRTVIPVCTAIAIAGFFSLNPQPEQHARSISAATNPLPTHIASPTAAKPPPPAPASDSLKPPSTHRPPPLADVASLPAEPGAAPEASLPEILGSLQIEPGVSLSKMIARVYGRYSPKKMMLVLQANPQIADPDRLALKSEVKFPTLPPSETATIAQDRVYLRLANATTLAEAYSAIKEFPGDSPTLLIVPTMAGGNGLTFHVIADEPLADTETALLRIKDLPRPWHDSAEPVTGTELRPREGDQSLVLEKTKPQGI